MVLGSEQFLRALHIPGLENRGTNLMSRGGTLADEWKLHPEVMQHIWNWFEKVEEDVFASWNNTHCLLWFSLMLQDDPPLGMDAIADAP